MDSRTKWATSEGQSKSFEYVESRQQFSDAADPFKVP